MSTVTKHSDAHTTESEQATRATPHCPDCGSSLIQAGEIAEIAKALGKSEGQDCYPFAGSFGAIAVACISCRAIWTLDQCYARPKPPATPAPEKRIIGALGRCTNCGGSMIHGPNTSGPRWDCPTCGADMTAYEPVAVELPPATPEPPEARYMTTPYNDGNGFVTDKQTQWGVYELPMLRAQELCDRLNAGAVAQSALAGRDRQLREANATIRELQASIKEAAESISEKIKIIVDRDATIRELQDQVETPAVTVVQILEKNGLAYPYPNPPQPAAALPPDVRALLTELQALEPSQFHAHPWLLHDQFKDRIAALLAQPAPVGEPPATRVQPFNFLQYGHQLGHTDARREDLKIIKAELQAIQHDRLMEGHVAMLEVLILRMKATKRTPLPADFIGEPESEEEPT